MNNKPSILIVEDDCRQNKLLTDFLLGQGYRVRSALDCGQAISLIGEEEPHLILSDVNLPDHSGLYILDHIQVARDLEIAFVAMTAFTSIDVAVEFMRKGADDYIAKPINLADLLARIGRALETKKVRSRLSQLESQVHERYSLNQIIGHSPTMQRIFRTIERVAPTNATVLITGRTGTGKEMVAKSIHIHSGRARGQFIDVDCGAMPEHLINSELFGYQKGAFTGATETRKGLFEVAGGGTIFLDEVHNLKSDLQTSLLRVLQERTFRRIGGRENIDIDVRIVAASNVDLAEAVRQGKFREDLYYRLNVISIHIPDLSARKEDIPHLITHFLKKGATRAEFNKSAFQKLMTYPWPGNVRELQNAIEYALVMGQPPFLKLEDLPIHICEHAESEVPRRTSDARSLESVERAHILRILEETGHDQGRTAEILGIDRRTLSRKLARYNEQALGS